jgi:hypothetical protein
MAMLSMVEGLFEKTGSLKSRKTFGENACFDVVAGWALSRDGSSP